MTVNVDRVDNAQVIIKVTEESGNVYDLSVNVVGNKVNGITNGSVRNANGIQIATISYYKNGGLNINYASIEYMGIEAEVKEVCKKIVESYIEVSATISNN